MKRNAYTWYAATFLVLLATTAGAEERILAGVGVGAQYSGLGLNVAMASDHSFGYVAFGCVASYENGDGKSGNACGAGIGFLRTDFFSEVSSKHALGVYAGPVSAIIRYDDIKTVYGLGFSYVYFLNGIGSRGLLVGATPALGQENGDTRGYLLLSLGYEF